jgi:hypothetical protein
MRRLIRRLIVRYWRQAAALVAVEAVLFAIITGSAVTPVLAGDTLPIGGSSWSNNGDCWQSQTPEMCRTSWQGKDSPIYMRIIDQLNNAQLHNDAGLACRNWNSAPGPQLCSYTPTSGDTFTYLKRDDSVPAPNGYTWNCVPGACPTGNDAGNILWSEIFVPVANLQEATACGITMFWSTQVFAHELGHAYGLAHHGIQCSNQAVMTQGEHSFLGPTSIDIGPFPGCSRGPGTGGIRCIYENT